MSAAAIVDASAFLPALVARASRALAEAASAAEVLDARDRAALAYDTAKAAARFAKANGAHDELIAAAHRGQADDLEIEASAQGKVGLRQLAQSPYPQKLPSARELRRTCVNVNLSGCYHVVIRDNFNNRWPMWEHSGTRSHSLRRSMQKGFPRDTPSHAESQP